MLAHPCGLLTPKLLPSMPGPTVAVSATRSPARWLLPSVRRKEAPMTATALTVAHRTPALRGRPGTNRCPASLLPATDLLPIRRPLLPLRYQEVGKSPQKQAKRTTPIPRVSVAFARHCWPSPNTNQSGRSVRFGLLMRFSGPLLRICDGRAGADAGVPRSRAGCMPS